MTTVLAHVATYCGEDPQAPSPDLQDALEAETAAQVHRCKVPAEASETDTDTWPADLLEALARRVARNLAARGNPLGFIPSLDDTGGGRFFGSTDPEVRRLEGPYRRLVVG